MGKGVEFEKISEHAGPGESPGFALWRISYLWRRKIEEVLRPFGITHPQFVILAVTGWLTREGKSVNQLRVAQVSSIDPSTTSQVLRLLERKGLIRRERLHGEKEKAPFLTESGQSILEKTLPLVEGQDRAFFGEDAAGLGRAMHQFLTEH